MVKNKLKKINIKTKKDKKTPIEKTTAPVAWTPWDLFENMDRTFWDDPWMPGWRRRWHLAPWSERWIESDTKITPLDLVDKGNEYKVVAEVPGVSKKDLEVNITPNGISICGETTAETKEEDEGYIRRERSYSTLCRNITFPEEVNPDGADATLKNGILEVRVPKKKPTHGRKIPIK
jgi:HSP20 family protein